MILYPPVLTVQNTLFYYVYILQSISRKMLYIGFTENLKERFRSHNANENPATKNRGPWKLIYYEARLNKYDALTHAIYSGNQVAGLRGWWCEFDGREATTEQIDDVRTIIEIMAVQIYRQTLALNFEQKKELYWRQKAWGYKPLFDYLGLPWQPAEAVIAAGRNRPIFNNWNFNDDSANNISIIKNLLDPREEIPAGVYRSAIVL